MTTLPNELWLIPIFLDCAEKQDAYWHCSSFYWHSILFPA